MLIGSALDLPGVHQGVSLSMLEVNQISLDSTAKIGLKRGHEAISLLLSLCCERLQAEKLDPAPRSKLRV